MEQIQNTQPDISVDSIKVIVEPPTLFQKIKLLFTDLFGNKIEMPMEFL